MKTRLKKFWEDHKDSILYAVKAVGVGAIGGAAITYKVVKNNTPDTVTEQLRPTSFDFAHDRDGTEYMMAYYGTDNQATVYTKRRKKNEA